MEKMMMGLWGLIIFLWGEEWGQFGWRGLGVLGWGEVGGFGVGKFFYGGVGVGEIF